MSDVPSDILLEILSRLPAASLLRFRIVCKAWCCIIDDPSFIKSHSKNHQSYSTLLLRKSFGGCLYSLSLDSLNFADGSQTIDAIPVKQLIRRDVPRMRKLPVASCNGLILLVPRRDVNKNWVIWNPLAQEFHKLPQLNTDLQLLSGESCRDSWSCGLGYDCAADDYKVVRIDKLHRQGVIVSRTLVYSLKLGSWRMIKDCPYDILLIDGVFLNGALHWRSVDRIIALDLGTEDYSELPWPPIKPGLCLHENLDALGGCLVLSFYDRRLTNRFDGWVMKDYGVEKSWMKLFSVEPFLDLRPVAYLKSKGQVLIQKWDGFLWVDAENDSVKKVTVDGLYHASFSQFCPGSLVRLDDSGSVSGSHVAARRAAQVSRKRKRVATRLNFCVRTAEETNKRLKLCARNTSVLRHTSVLCCADTDSSC